MIPSPERMTAGAPSMNGNTTPEGGTATGGGKLDASSSREASQGDGSNVNQAYDEQQGGMQQPKDTKEPESPSQTYAHLTPQPQIVGYPTYPSQVTPASPSPAANAVFTDAYGGGFLGPRSAGAFIAHTNPFGGHPSPLSPPRPTSGVAAAGVPANSPLFPRLSGTQSNLNPNGFDRVMPQPPSPTLAYTTAGGGYQAYAGSGGSLQQSGSTDESQMTPGGWMDAGMGHYTQNSPQLSATGMPMYGMPMGRSNSGRNGSFDEASMSMLPPSALDAQDPSNPTYSPYSQGSSNGGNIFQSQQPWGYGGLPEMYSNSQASPLQPRPTHHIPMGYPVPQMRPMGYGAYYPACSPGPPIQTTASNKGPQGSNLFVFHIPNNMTNLDMFQLFSPFGNLISVRIMVEKDTGRSRGFGFVSYDNPESAALAIKELNGYAIGNKRLKVQHKQIRPKDIQQERDHMHGYGMPSDGYDRGSSLPPSGPGAAGGWLSGPSGSEMTGSMPDSHDGKVDENTEQTSTSTNGETPSSLPNEGPMGMSPLATLGTLQDALPEASG